MDHIKTNHQDICGTLNRAGKYKTRLWDIEKGPMWYRAFFKQSDVFLWCTKLREKE